MHELPPSTSIHAFAVRFIFYLPDTQQSQVTLYEKKRTQFTHLISKCHDQEAAAAHAQQLDQQQHHRGQLQRHSKPVNPPPPHIQASKPDHKPSKADHPASSARWPAQLRKRYYHLHPISLD